MPRVIPSGARNLLLPLALLLLLPVTTAAAAETYKVPGTKGGFLRTPEGIKIHYLEAGKPQTQAHIGLVGNPPKLQIANTSRLSSSSRPASSATERRPPTALCASCT
jgi:hypothetical protein